MRNDISNYDTDGADVLLKFLLVASIVGLCCAPLWVYRERSSPSKAKNKASKG